MPEFPAFLKPISAAHDEVINLLRDSNPAIDWFYFSPAAAFGAHAPGQKLGHYRLGTNILIKNDAGESIISGQDYATAFVDEIDTPTHHRAQLTAAY